MRPISVKVKQEIDADPKYKRCARIKDGGCMGRITMEHALIYAGRQIDEKWAIVPLCARHHSVDGWQDCGLLNKEINVCIALNQATDTDLIKYSKAIDYIGLKHRLNEKYKKRY